MPYDGLLHIATFHVIPPIMANNSRTTVQTTGDLADVFARRRSMLRMTQSEMAKVAGIGRYAIASIERAKPGTGIERLLALIDILQMDLVLIERPQDVSKIPTGENDE